MSGFSPPQFEQSSRGPAASLLCEPCSSCNVTAQTSIPWSARKGTETLRIRTHVPDFPNYLLRANYRCVPLKRRGLHRSQREGRIRRTLQWVSSVRMLASGECECGTNTGAQESCTAVSDGLPLWGKASVKDVLCYQYIRCSGSKDSAVV